ncbi:MAG: hypothetical protein NT028_14675 [candidate division Zixibacteria bacterium]|nr:hypothetical protein [candidate division Zixibacteria bacterium]
MRPFELALQKYPEFLAERVERRGRRVGLLCSFAEEHKFESGGYYDFAKLRAWIQLACKELGYEAPHVVGQRLNSHQWLAEVLEVILDSDLVIAEISHPTDNVIYEVGIATSLRAQESVLVCSRRPAQVRSNEILQLQITWYDDYTDIRRILEEFMKSQASGLAKEMDVYLKNVHSKLSPGAIGLLLQMQENVWNCIKGGQTVRWHLSYQLPLQTGQLNPQQQLTITPIEVYANEIVEARIAHFDYSFHGTGWQWALHPTLLGKHYLASDHFCMRFHDPAKANQISHDLKGIL